MRYFIANGRRISYTYRPGDDWAKYSIAINNDHVELVECVFVDTERWMYTHKELI